MSTRQSRPRGGRMRSLAREEDSPHALETQLVPTRGIPSSGRANKHQSWTSPVLSYGLTMSNPRSSVTPGIRPVRARSKRLRLCSRRYGEQGQSFHHSRHPGKPSTNWRTCPVNGAAGGLKAKKKAKREPWQYFWRKIVRPL